MRFVKRTKIHLSLLSLLAFLSLGAARERPLVAILVLPSSELSVSSSDVYAVSRKAIEKNTIFRVANLDVFSRSLEGDAVRECAGNGRCFAIKLNESGSNADWLITVAMDRLGDDLALGLRLIDIKAALRGEGGERVLSEVLPNSVPPLRGVTDLLPRLFQNLQWGQLAALTIEVDQSDAEILVDERICLSPCQMKRLQVGTHRVTVRKRGYTTVTKKVELRPASREKLRISLESEPGSEGLSPVLVWGGVGLGLVAAAATTWYFIDSADRPIEICIAADRAQCGL